MLVAPSQAKEKMQDLFDFLFITVASIEPESGPYTILLREGHGVQDTRASQKHLSEQLQSLEQNVVLKDRVRITGFVAARKRAEAYFDC